LGNETGDEMGWSNNLGGYKNACVYSETLGGRTHFGDLISHGRGRKMLQLILKSR
jgi:hypothetical protein